MSLNLSERIKTIVELCDQVDCIVDIGTDHGFVPITIANNKIAKKVIATDIKKAPLDVCKKNIELYLDDKDFDITTLVCDGLSGIDKNLSIGIIITGMGFDNIKKILNNIDDYNYRFLILSPQTKINEFIVFAHDKNLMIETIKTIYEDDKMYLIFKCYNRKVWDRLYGGVYENI